LVKPTIFFYIAWGLDKLDEGGHTNCFC